MRRKYLTMLLLLTFFLFACGTATKNGNETDHTIINKTEESDVTKVTGIYIGQIDGNTIEVETADGPFSFRIDQVIAEKITEFAEGQEVSVTYVENSAGQLIIKEIHKK